MKAALNTIRNHVEHIDLILKAHDWGKPAKECLAEIAKSTSVIRIQVEYLSKKTKGGE